MIFPLMRTQVTFYQYYLQKFNFINTLIYLFQCFFPVQSTPNKVASKIIGYID